MKTIHKLSDLLISQIAAGEVIERPCFVIKELVDNAIDAHATDIRIILEDFGLKKIVVRDNGEGMSREDLLESYKLHTTSKIGEIDQLLGISTLGFRGEALASIASVSQLEIQSKTTNETVGNSISVAHGTNISHKKVGMPKGTYVQVSNLFENIPVRKKFLSNKKQELNRIVDIIIRYATSHPSISFDLLHNHKPLLVLRSVTSLEARIKDMFGDTIHSHLIPFSLEDSYMKIEGFLTTPQLNGTNTIKQYVAINGRPVFDRTLSAAIKEGYGILLEKDTLPSYFLLITIAPEMVNINIHPRKEYVHIENVQYFMSSITTAVTDLLNKQSLDFQGFPYSIHDTYEGLTYTPLARQLKKMVLPIKTEQMRSSSRSNNFLQIHNLYIVVETEHGITMIDQHAAHERILYEEFTRALIEEKNKSTIYPLPDPILLKLTPHEVALYTIFQEDFITLGFDIEIFHGNSMKIYAVPSLFKDRHVKELLNDMLKNLENEILSPSIDIGTKKLLAYLACRSAVKSGDPLTHEQIQMIISELQKIPSGITCPHGRPLQYIIPLTDVHKMFKRR